MNVYIHKILCGHQKQGDYTEDEKYTGTPTTFHCEVVGVLKLLGRLSENLLQC